MEQNEIFWAEVDEQGRVILPAEVTRQFGARPGARMRIEQDEHGVRLHRPITQLRKIYIEPTSYCNLACRTCIRNNWDETMGRMSDETFAHVLEGLRALDEKPLVFFGGLGEPLHHPRTIEWIAQAKALGARVEMITNGTMLNKTRARQLIDAGLDTLWVSIDGATPDHYADVRLGAQLPRIIENVRRFREMRKPAHRPTPEIGVAFVAMKRNITDLPEIIRIGRSLGASRFSVSNVLPYTEEMIGEVLYNRTLSQITYLPSPWLPKISLPKMDLNETTSTAFLAALNSGCNVSFAGNNLGGSNDVCSFIESGSTAIGWDGSLSPCLALLHTHYSYLHGKPRLNRRHTIGSVNERPLLDLWNDAGYAAYREGIQGFAFAPCTFCGGCDLSQANEEDCLANEFPACGGCLWAQAVIQCP